MDKKMMSLGIILGLLACWPVSAFATEDTAQITFSKTAITSMDLHVYTIKKGDMLSAIVRKLPDVTEKDIPRIYKQTRELNPDIKDFNRLHPGQQLVLPGRAPEVTPLRDSVAPETTDTAVAAASPSPAPLAPAIAQGYTVRSGDSLIRIVHRELNIRSNTQAVLLQIRALNPEITDINRIYPGQVIHLPEYATTGRPVDTVVLHTGPSPIEETHTRPDLAEMLKATTQMSMATRLSVVRHIITAMQGTVVSNGNYYLPVSDTEQWVIDCSRIPVIELDATTTVFLDLENRAHPDLRKMINEKFKHYHLIKISEKDDLIVILRKIFQTDRHYNITKLDRPPILGKSITLNLVADWLITRKHPGFAHPPTQALRLVYEDSPLLPGAVTHYARRHQIAVTEISVQDGLIHRPEELYALEPVTVLPSETSVEFAAALLDELKIPYERDVEIKIFDIAEDGFNLAIKADLIATHQETPHVIFSRKLPDQFVGILTKAGNELVFISDEEDRSFTLNKLLRAFDAVSTAGQFTFSGLDVKQPPYAISFNGVKMKSDQDIYFVNFDFDESIRGLLDERWSARIIRY